MVRTGERGSTRPGATIATIVPFWVSTTRLAGTCAAKLSPCAADTDASAISRSDVYPSASATASGSALADRSITHASGRMLTSPSVAWTRPDVGFGAGAPQANCSSNCPRVTCWTLWYDHVSSRTSRVATGATDVGDGVELGVGDAVPVAEAAGETATFSRSFTAPHATVPPTASPPAAKVAPAVWNARLRRRTLRVFLSRPSGAPAAAKRRSSAWANSSNALDSETISVFLSQCVAVVDHGHAG